MRAIAKYSFVGDARQSQLSFPIGAELVVKSKTANHGWMLGSYDGKQGWFPMSYVEFQRPRVRLEHHRKEAKPDMSLYPENQNQNTSTSDTPPLTSISFERNAAGVSDILEDEDDFQLMGGEPGSLFDSTPVYAASVENVSTHTPPVLYPTNVYGNVINSKYLQASSEAAIYVTDKIPDPPPVRKATPEAPVVAQQQAPGKFWETHPPRNPFPTKTGQVAAVDQAFENINDGEQIKIVDEPKKRRFFPKKVMKAVRTPFHKMHA